MSTIPVPASTAEAADMVLAGLRYLAATDPTALAAQAQAGCLQALEQGEAICTAARAWILAAFIAGHGYSAAVPSGRHGNRIWHQAKALLDSEHARRAVGEVAVPFGGCAEPSNVKAGGHACPYRFRCAGCDHFRTDASYLPDLTAYLDDLLRTQERLAAAASLDEWARADAMPSDEEITRIRRLINRIKTTLDDLTPQERAEVDQAVAAVRRHRAISLGMPRIRQPLPVTGTERTA